MRPFELVKMGTSSAIASDDKGAFGGIFAEEETTCEYARGVFLNEFCFEQSRTVTSSSELSSIVIAVALVNPICFSEPAIVVETIQYRR